MSPTLYYSLQGEILTINSVAVDVDFPEVPSNLLLFPLDLLYDSLVKVRSYLDTDNEVGIIPIPDEDTLLVWATYSEWEEEFQSAIHDRICGGNHEEGCPKDYGEGILFYIPFDFSDPSSLLDVVSDSSNYTLANVDYLSGRLEPLNSLEEFNPPF